MDEKILRGLHADIVVTQGRFCVAMERRLPDIEPETLERYFGLLSKLVGKLEDPAKSFREVMSEMMGDAAAIVLQEMQARRP